MKRQAASRLLGVALALALPACATKSKAPAAGPGTDFLRSYFGQQRVLRFQGDQERVVVKKKDRPQLPGACDAAVQVRSAVLEKGGPRLVLEALGAAGAEKAHPRCRHIPATITLSLTGFGGDSGPIVGRLDQVLPTPEGYLRAYGVPFDHVAGREPAVVASNQSTINATDDERRLERKVTAWPRKLFWVEPVYRDPRKAVRWESEVDFEAVIGADGRLYRPQVKGGLDKTHVAAIARALSMWRFEPARAGKDPVAAYHNSRLIFRIY
jgi:hypothetical protein